LDSIDFTPQTRAFIRDHRDDDVSRLALCKAPEAVDLPMALRQIEGYQTARRKLPSWAAVKGVIYPPRLAMEQCSSETTARWKACIAARLLGAAPHAMVDLTGGFGIDCCFLSSLFQQATYVERQENLCRFAAHNFPLLSRTRIAVRQEDAEAFLEQMNPVDFLFIDPARRDTQGRKTVALADCSPDLQTLCPMLLSRACYVMAKLSPMLDINQAVAQLTNVCEVHVLSVSGECKELLLVLSAQPSAVSGPTTYCTLLDGKGGAVTCSFAADEERLAQPLYAISLGACLYEPDAAVMKAGQFKSIAVRFGLRQLAPNSHLYTSDVPAPDFPGRRFVIEQVYSFSKQDLKALSASCRQANIAVRNFPATPADLRKRLKMQDGGDVYLFATTLSDRQRVLIRCRKAL
jgi:hypothetical protein